MSVSTFTSADGEGYERLMGRWSRRLVEPFLDFVGCADGEDVLDLGCGTGCLSSAIVRRCNVRSVLGVDLSESYVEYARTNNRNPQVTFETGNACELGVPSARFDRVLSLLMLHFVPKTAQAIAEMKRVAKPGALVGAAVWDARGGYVANRIFFDTAAALDPAASERRARNYTRPLTRPGELSATWRSAGFTDVEEASLSIRMEFASFDDYWQPYCGNDGPQADYLKTLAEPEWLRVRDAVQRAYLDGEADGPRSYAALAWAVKGRAT